MCWITLTPKPKRHHHHGHHHQHHNSDHGSSVEELVRIRDGGPHRKIRIIAPIDAEKHHHHPHIHPLHMHPPSHHHWKIHGPGKKRTPATPPPTRSPSSCPSPAEPIYRTQIVEPAAREVRETTRIALREARPERGRLRRVAGYEVLGREVPWDWECVSSVASQGREGKKGRRLRYPPFGSMARWM